VLLRSQGLDQYEGIDKGYYRRPTVEVSLTTTHDGRAAVVTAAVYAMPHSPAALRALPPVPEYTLRMHRER
jgi:hypothetical protein